MGKDFEQLSIFDIFGETVQTESGADAASVAKTADSAASGQTTNTSVTVRDSVALEDVRFRNDGKKRNIVIRRVLSNKDHVVKWRVIVDDAKTLGYNDFETMCKDWGLDSAKLTTVFGKA